MGGKPPVSCKLIAYRWQVIIQGVAPDAGNEQSRERTIRITLERGTMVRSSRKEPDKSWQAPEPIPETKAKYVQFKGRPTGQLADSPRLASTIGCADRGAAIRLAELTDPALSSAKQDQAEC